MTIDSPEIIRPKDLRVAEFNRIFFVLGNAPCHKFVHELLLERGGETILHDSRLFEFYLVTEGLDATAAIASAELRRPVTHEDLEAWARHRNRLPTPLLERVVKASTKIHVFNLMMVDALKRFYGAQAHYIPVPVHNRISADALWPDRIESARRRLGLENDVIHLCSFGTVDPPSKGCFETILALGEIQQYGRRCQWHVVGSVDEGVRTQMLHYATEHGVAELLSFHNNVSPERYELFLLGADIGIQLRKAPFGQMSAGLTDCICAGLWTIANESLAEAGMAPNFVHRIPDSLSPLRIALAVLDIVDQRDTKQRDINAREQYMEGRDFAAFARNLLDE